MGNLKDGKVIKTFQLAGVGKKSHTEMSKDSIPTVFLVPALARCSSQVGMEMENPGRENR